jgi:glucose-6-phosphate isomerase
LATEEELLKFGAIAGSIAEAKLEAANKADASVNRRVVEFRQESPAAGTAIQRLEKVINELKQNTGLPFAMPEPTFTGSAYNFWSKALKILYFDKPVYRRVESVPADPNDPKHLDKDGNVAEITSGVVINKNAIEKLPGVYDISKYKGGTRGVADLKVVLQDESAVNSDDAYYMHRGVFASEEDIEKAFYGDNRLRYDITVIPPNTWGAEPAKTMGHFHDNINYPEVYQVLSGEVMWLMQKMEDNKIEGGDVKVKRFVAVRAKAGDIAVMLPGYGHVSVNISETEPLVMADWLTWHQKSNYGPFKTKKGAAYYLVRENGSLKFMPNKEYVKTQELPPVEQMTASNKLEKSLGLRQGMGIYALVNQQRQTQEEFNARTEYLYHPEGYMGILTPEQTLENVSPDKVIRVESAIEDSQLNSMAPDESRRVFYYKKLKEFKDYDSSSWIKKNELARLWKERKVGIEWVAEQGGHIWVWRVEPDLNTSEEPVYAPESVKTSKGGSRSLRLSVPEAAMINDREVGKDTSFGFLGFMEVLEKIRIVKGALVIGADAILKNPGAITTLKEIKDKKPELKIVVWTQDKKTADVLNTMQNLRAFADTINEKGLKDTLRKLADSGISRERIVLINSLIDVTNILSEFKVGKFGDFIINPEVRGIRALGIDPVTIKGFGAGSMHKINSMPLVISRAIVALCQDYEPLFDEFKKVARNNGISGKSLEDLEHLDQALTMIPLEIIISPRR